MTYFETLYQHFMYQDLILISVAIFIGLIIGGEREYHNKTAGLRTLMLVSIGSCVYTILSIKIGAANPDRIAANIITGVGFLGAGAIFKDEDKINGLTTACTIWVMAALGMAVGSGHIYFAIFGSIVVLFVLTAVLFFEKWIEELNKSLLYKITTPYSSESIAYFENLFHSFHLKYSKVHQNKIQDLLVVHWRIVGAKKKHTELISKLYQDQNISELEI